jgi:hypothetical protein
MPINRKLNLVFLHIPKAAGTTVEKILDMSCKSNFFTIDRNHGGNVNWISLEKFSEEEKQFCAAKNMQHFTFLELKKILEPEFFNNAFKFSVVRNPYSRIISEYFFVKKIAGFNPLLTNIEVDCPSFSFFVKTQLILPRLQRVHKFDGHLETQASFLLNENGDLSSINKIYKFETEMQDCLDFCRQRANINIMNIHAREGDYDKNIAQYYDAETKDLVYNFYKQDFDLFGYNKDL